MEHVLSGEVQKQLDSIWDWSLDNFIDFHVTGKKRPFYYVFRKSHVNSDGGIWDANLKFHTTKFDRGYQKRQLGVLVNLYKDSVPTNRYGYELEWRGKRPLSNVAYRLQEMKYSWDTSFLRTSVQAYVVGKLQFAAALYWLRGSQASIKRARFDYCIRELQSQSSPV